MKILILCIIFLTIIAIVFWPNAKTELYESVSIKWTHPEISGIDTVEIIDKKFISDFAKLLEGFDKPETGNPHDTPFYDCEVIFKGQGGQIGIPIYLPRKHAFPGMWKHPNGHLYYFSHETDEHVELLRLIGEYIPNSKFYPSKMPENPPGIDFEKGIPNFTGISWPIEAVFE